MRVRITRRLKGSVDGIQLRRYQVGEVYDVGTCVGNYLMACGHATPVVEEQPVVGAVESPRLNQPRRWSSASAD